MGGLAAFWSFCSFSFSFHSVFTHPSYYFFLICACHQIGGGICLIPPDVLSEESGGVGGGVIMHGEFGVSSVKTIWFVLGITGEDKTHKKLSCVPIQLQLAMPTRRIERNE